jgi:lysozyme family protein
MQHPYTQLAPTFAHYWANAKVKPERQAEALNAGERLLRNLSAYQSLEEETRVPALWTMCVNERESGGDMNTYLGNGDRLGSVTRDVPRGRGPFPTWPAGAKDALHLDGIDAVPVWNSTRSCFEWVLWNGWGYGTASPYLLGGTDLQRPGKYTADNHYNPNVWDTQLGCIALAWGITQHMPTLAFAPDAEVAPQDQSDGGVPITVGGSAHDAKWLQAALNQVTTQDARMKAAIEDLGGPPALTVDGNVGRQTRLYVRAFEQLENLAVDRGFPGPQVLGALDKVLGTGWQSQS